MAPKTDKNNTIKFSISNTTSGKLPSLPFASMKDAVLGKNYELSVVFASRATMRRLNLTYRGKDKPTDILSFSLEKNKGEIYTNTDEAKKEAKKIGRNFENFLGFLFIHGLVHLEGFTHGSRMEARERKFRKKFNIWILATQNLKRKT